MVSIESLVIPDPKEKPSEEPQDNQEYLAAEPNSQAKEGINPCGNEHWDPKWDEQSS